jgi:hypothetical protein
MNAVRSHFRLHGTVHLVWTIATLIFLLVVAIVRLPNAATLTSIVSFAASIASLVLAVVAIFYSMISNGSFNDSAIVLNRSADEVRRAADELGTNLNSYLNRSTDLLLAVEKVPSTVTRFGENLEERVVAAMSASAPSRRDALPPADGKVDLGSASMINGVAIALYAIGQSLQHQQHFSPEDITHDSTYLEGIIAGVCSTLKLFPRDGISVNGVGTRFITQSLGTYTAQEFDRLSGDEDDEFIINSKKAVDAYFNPASSSGEQSEV